jgi:hypothetical protein
MLNIDGLFVSVTCNNNFSGHGMYQFSPELYLSCFNQKYGMEIIDMYIAEVGTTNNEWKNVNSFNGYRNIDKFNSTLETYIIIIARKISNERESLIKNCPNQYSYDDHDWKKYTNNKPNFKYKLSACLLIKNETENLNDWIEHYINEGVEHFFITSNNSTDGIDNFILNSEYKNMITLITDNSDIDIYNDQVKHREILCKNFYNIIKNSTEWCILVDIDEFMYGKNGYKLSSFIDTLDEDIGCFYVYWNIFKPTLDSENNISDKFSLKKSCKRINLDLISNLSYEIKFASKFGKSIFRTSMLQDHTQLWIHKVTTSGKIITNYGNISDYKYDNTDDIYWSELNYKNVNVALNHYAIRNKKDYDNKLGQLENTHRYPFVKGLLDICELDNKYIIEDRTY